MNTKLYRIESGRPSWHQAKAGTAHGYVYESVNDLTRGTYPVPGFPVEARLDWLAAKGIDARDPVVIPAAMSPRRKRPVSDHHAVGARFLIREATA